MSMQPCQNPSCKSYGRPHPNCRCFGEMAEGGEAEFCSNDRMHNKECEYYADGGAVEGQDFDNLSEDQPSSPQATQAPNAAPVIPVEEQDFDKLTDDGHNVEGHDFDNLVDDSTAKYQTPGQKILTGAESLAQGFAPGLSTFVETHLPVETGIPHLVGTAEDIAARQQANPGISAAGNMAGIAGGLASGVGEAPLVGRAIATGLGEAPLIGRAVQAFSPVGQKILGSFLTGAAQQGGDQIAQSLLGAHPDTGEVVGSALMGGGLNALTEGAFSGLNHGLTAAKESKLASHVQGFLQGMHDAAEGSDQYLGGPYANGMKAYKEGLQYLSDLAAHKAIFATGMGASIPGALFAQKFLAEPIGKMFAAGSEKLGRYIAPVIGRIVSSPQAEINTAPKLDAAINFAKTIGSGVNKVNPGIENLFKSGSQEAVEEYNKKDTEKLKKYIDDHGHQQDLDQSIQNENQNVVPQFAEGGVVIPMHKPERHGLIEQHKGLVEALPEHNMALSNARNRIHGYLLGKKPMDNTPRPVFDEHMEDPEAAKQYHKALRIAANPTGILKQMRNGTLDQEDVGHLDAMHPEAAQIMRNALNKRILQAKLDGDKPPYAMRQQMSLFLKQPVSADTSPATIQAAQNTFVMQKGPGQQEAQQAGKKGKKSSSSLGKVAGQFMTDEQARISDSQKH